MNADEFIDYVKKALKVDGLRMTVPPNTKIEKVALCTGAGSEFMNDAKRANADVFITGDMKHHSAQSADEMGLWVIDAGHFGTEKHVVDLFRQILESYEETKALTILSARSLRDYMIYK